MSVVLIDNDEVIQDAFKREKTRCLPGVEVGEESLKVNTGFDSFLLSQFSQFYHVRGEPVILHLNRNLDSVIQQKLLDSFWFNSYEELLSYWVPFQGNVLIFVDGIKFVKISRNILFIAINNSYNDGINPVRFLHRSGHVVNTLFVINWVRVSYEKL